MAKKLDPEIKAMRQMVRALRGLDGESIRRVLRWVIERHTYQRSNEPKGGVRVDPVDRT